MTTKTRMYAEIAEQAARQVTESRENWTSFSDHCGEIV